MSLKYPLIILVLAGFVVHTQTFGHRSYGLLEIAGSITVSIKPGESKSFQWGLLPDKGKPANVTISTYGNGSQFLSFPKTVELPSSGNAYVPIKVSIPSNYSGIEVLTPKLRATEAGIQGNGPLGSIVNVEVAKNVTIRVVNISDIGLPK